MEQRCLVKLYTRWQRDASEIEPHAHTHSKSPTHTQTHTLGITTSPEILQLHFPPISLSYISHLSALPSISVWWCYGCFFSFFFLNPHLTDSYCLMFVYGFLCSREVAAMQQTDTQRSGRRCARRVQNKACISPVSHAATLTTGGMCAQAFIHLQLWITKSFYVNLSENGQKFKVPRYVRECKITLFYFRGQRRRWGELVLSNQQVAAAAG